MAARLVRGHIDFLKKLILGLANQHPHSTAALMTTNIVSMTVVFLHASHSRHERCSLAFPNERGRRAKKPGVHYSLGRLTPINTWSSP